LELPLLPLPEPGEPESGAMSVPVALSFGVLLPVGVPSPAPVVSAPFALLASFAGRSWLQAVIARPKVETNTAVFSRNIVFLS